MSLKETHEWAKEKMEQWEGLTKEVANVSSTHPKQVTTPPYMKFSNPSFYGDVVRTSEDLIFHFFPTEDLRFNMEIEMAGEKVWTFDTSFAECLADAFLAVFKHEDRMFWDYANELKSWVVRCVGYGANPLVGDLIEGVLVQIKARYEK